MRPKTCHLLWYRNLLNMKKNIFALALLVLATIFLLSFSQVNWAYIANELAVKRTGDLTDSNSIAVNSSGGLVDFVIKIIVDGDQPSREYRVGLLPLPSGLTASGYTIESDDCTDINGGTTGNLAIDSLNNGNFVFRFQPTGAGICENIVIAHYKTSGITNGNYTLNYTLTDSVDGIFWNGNDSASTSNNITMTVQSTVSIIKAQSFDTNGNGYVNGYNVTLNNPLPATLLTPSQIAITSPGKTATGISFEGTTGSYTGRILWSDGLFDTGITPQIQIFWDSNYESEQLFAGVVEDTAGPGIFITPAAGTYTGSQTVSASMSETGSIRYSMTGTATQTSPTYTGAFTINSPVTLSFFASDLAGNTTTTSRAYSFSCSNSAPANGTISAYPSCTIGCNSGYDLASGSCVVTYVPPSSGGGWGGGGGSIVIQTPDFCPSGDVSGSLYDKICTKTPASGTWSSQTSTGTSNLPSTEIPLTKNPNTKEIPWFPQWPLPNPNILLTDRSKINDIYFRNNAEARSFIHANIKSDATKKMVNTYAARLSISDLDYYLSFDRELFNEYHRAMNAYVIYVTRQDAWNRGDRSILAKNDIDSSLAILKEQITLVKNRDLRYVSRALRNSQDVYVYRTKTTDKSDFFKAQRQENKIISKLYRLWTTNSITAEEYQNSLRSYNSYILHLNISQEYPNYSQAKERADLAYAELMNTYEKRVKFTPKTSVSTSDSASQKSEKTIWDYYTFTKTLKEGDSNEEVVKLQEILKRYGYFEGLAPTGYFGSITKSSLIKFSKEILGIKNPTGTLDDATRQKLLKVIWK